MIAALQQYDRIMATYRPMRTDDLKPGVANYIGFVCEWQALWIIEDGDYGGQWAMQPDLTFPGSVGWVPECDLERIGKG